MSAQETLMGYQSGSIVVLIIFVCASSARFGRQRRQLGRPVTPREVLLVMAGTWALAWLWLGLPSLADWGRHMPWSEVIRAALGLFGLAIAPLTFVLAVTWLPRLVARTARTEKKPAGPQPLN
jgi:hypothetical protein